MLGRIAWICFALLLCEHIANAFSDRAGSCKAGVPLQGEHILNEQLAGGPLSDNGFEVRLNGAALDFQSQNNVPVTDDAQELTLVATADNTFFRGFLIRIEGENVDTTDFLDIPEGDDNIRVVSLCILVEDVGGVSHTNNNEKTEATALLRIPQVAMNLTMDVTMVVQNRDGAAEWYNSRYILNAGGSTVTPTVSPSPTAPPTTSPVPTVPPQPTVPMPSDESFVPTTATNTAMPSESPLKEQTSSGNSHVISGVAVSLVFVLATIV